jgi:hypothetical protein
MKNFMLNARYKLPMLFFCFMTGIYAYAQDSSGSVESHSAVSHSSTSSSSSGTVPMDNTAMWYNSPWVWVVGALLLIVILLAIFRSSNGSKSEVSRTVKSTTEVKND